MYSFLVLGMIPGTNVQISFLAWLTCLAILAVTVATFTISHRRRQQFKSLVSQLDSSLRKLHAKHPAQPAK